MQCLEEFLVAGFGHGEDFFFHGLAVQFLGMLCCIGGVGAVLVFDGDNCLFVQFVERGLVLGRLVEVCLEFVRLVGFDGLLHVEVLHEIQLQLLVLGEDFHHFLSLGKLFAGEGAGQGVNVDFIVLAEVDSDCTSAGCGYVAHDFERREGHFDEQVHDGLPHDLQVREFGILHIALHGNVELDFVILVFKDVEAHLHGDGEFRVGVAVLVGHVDVVDIDGVLAIDIPIVHLVFAGECHGSRADGVAGVVVAVRRKVLKGQVLHADVGVHGANVGEGSLIFKIQDTAFGECCRYVDGAGSVEIDIGTVDGNVADLVVEGLFRGMVCCGYVGVGHLQFFDDSLEGLGLFGCLGFFIFCRIGWFGLGGLAQRFQQNIDVGLAVLEEV